jgi:hypothetical protein
MAGDPLRKVAPGAPLVIPAAAYNAFIDAVRELKSMQTSGPEALKAGLPHSNIVRCVNQVGAEILQYGVVGLDDPVTTCDSADANTVQTFSANDRLFKAVVPTVANHADRFALAMFSVENNAEAIGSFAVAGIYPCKVDVTNEAHVFATVKEGSIEMLASADSGLAQILWKEPGTGTKWATVRLGGTGGGGGSFALAQATADGTGGTVTLKAVQHLVNLSASPNFEQTGANFTAKYFKI